MHVFGSGYASGHYGSGKPTRVHVAGHAPTPTPTHTPIVKTVGEHGVIEECTNTMSFPLELPITQEQWKSLKGSFELQLARDLGITIEELFADTTSGHPNESAIKGLDHVLHHEHSEVDDILLESGAKVHATSKVNFKVIQKSTGKTATEARNEARLKQDQMKIKLNKVADGKTTVDGIKVPAQIPKISSKMAVQQKKAPESGVARGVNTSLLLLGGLLSVLYSLR